MIKAEETMMISGPDWPALLAAARSGDAVAFGEICARWQDYLLLVASAELDRNIRTKVGPSDIVQQSLLEAHRDINRFQGGSELELRNWLERLVKNNLLDERRRYLDTLCRDAARDIPYEVESIAGRDPTASSILVQQETDEQLKHAVARLPARRRKVIELRHAQRLSFAEIGAELQISEAAARQLWVRTVDELRTLLSERDGRLPHKAR